MPRPQRGAASATHRLPGPRPLSLSAADGLKSILCIQAIVLIGVGCRTNGMLLRHSHMDAWIDRETNRQRGWEVEGSREVSDR